jgi:hypothetical protein
MGFLRRLTALFSRARVEPRVKKKRYRGRSKGVTGASRKIVKRRGYPRGYPHKRDYHTKRLFGLRFSEEVMREFKRLCKARNVHVNEVLELYMRQVLDKRAKEKVFKRLTEGRKAKRI